jgi:L-alanine-DL-glutamate epimerase-like enolase superfamily enzyme
MNWSLHDLDLTTTHPFVIARGGGSVFENLVLRLEAGGLFGEGEVHPSAYHGQTRPLARCALEHILPALADETLTDLDAVAVARILDRADAILGGNAAAKAALDGALWDLAGKQAGRPVWSLLGLDGGACVETSFTLALAEPPLVLARAREAVAAGFTVLKLKAGNEADLALIERVLGETGARVRVDANGAWTAKQALPTIERLALAGVELIEQPLAREDLAGYRALAGRCAIPVVLDESVRDPLDLALVGEYVDGVNLKIVKHGGISRSVALAQAARAAGLDLMIGCMIESSLGIAQALQILSLVRWADLDGWLLLAADPYQGLEREGATLRAPAGPGLGVSRRTR